MSGKEVRGMFAVDPKKEIIKNKTGTWEKNAGAIGVAAAAFLIYWNTLAHGVVWGDSAKLTQFVYDFSLSVRPEFHPLHTIIGKLFSLLPFHDYAFRINFMSAFFGAVNIALLYLLILRWTGSAPGATAGALALAVSHVYWLLSVMTETYTLFSFLLILEIWSLALWDDTKLDRFLYSAAFIFGLSISNNYLMPFFLPGFLFFILSAQSRPPLNTRRLALIFAFACIGGSIWIYLALSSMAGNGQAFLDLVHGGAFKRYYKSPFKIIHEVLFYPAYLMYQFPLAGFIAGCLGAWQEKNTQRRRFFFLLILLVSDVVFASGYMRQKQFYLLIASFVVFSLWIGIGASVFFSWLEKKGRNIRAAKAVSLSLIILLPLGLYASIQPLSKALRVDLVGARSLPYRDNVRFFLVPFSDEKKGAERYGREVFNIVEPNSIIIADFTPIAVLRYYQDVLGMRKDVRLKLIDFDPLDVGFVDRYIHKRPIYLANNLEPDYNITGLKLKYDVVPVGPIFKIVPRSTNQGKVLDSGN